jgi:hypothetical protein
LVFIQQIISGVSGFIWDGDFNKLCATLISQFGPRPLPALSGSAIEAREVLCICSRRAIFTDMKDEISTEKMFASIEACIASLQQLNLDITDKSLTQYVKSIIRDLDDLDRYSRDAPNYTVFFPDFIKEEMNSIKLSIIDKLHFLNVWFNVGVDLPNDIGFSYAVRELHPSMAE